MDCLVNGCVSDADWWCIDSGLRYCDAHKRKLGSHGPGHRWKKISQKVKKAHAHERTAPKAT